RLLIGEIPLGPPRRSWFLLKCEDLRIRKQRKDKNQQKRRSVTDRTMPVHLAVPPGVSIARATRRAPFRMAREELLTEMDARETAATSPPTLNGSRMSLPLNCAANSGRSTEK